MGRLSWHSTLRVAALLAVAFFVAGSVLQAILSFDLTGAPPPDKPDFLDTIEAFFAFENGRAAIDLGGSTLFALAFLALAAVGILLSRLAENTDARRSLGAAAFLGSAGLGVAAQLTWIAIKPVITSPHYCDCGFRAEEVTSRLTILHVAGNLNLWLTIGFIVIASIAFVLVARLGADAGLGNGWAWLSYATAAVGLLAAAVSASDIHPAGDLLTLLVAGILLPVWALWVAIRAPRLAGPEGALLAEPMEPESPPTG